MLPIKHQKQQQQQKYFIRQKNFVSHKPARSTKFMLLLFLVSWPVWFLLIWSKTIVTTVWALELVAFIWVAATVRLAVPVGWNNSIYYMAESMNRQDLANPAFWLVTQAGKMSPCLPHSGFPTMVPQEKFFFFGHTINPLLASLVWSRWLCIGPVRSCV